MEHDSSGCSSGEFPGAMECLKGSPVFPDAMFQMEIRVQFLQISSLIPVSGFHSVLIKSLL